jgi:hypothetical protein
MQLQGRTLSIGQRGDDVRLLQQELRQLGFEIADAEGLLGETTEAAVRSFQRQHGFDPTGEVNESTAAKLEAVLRPAERFVRGRVTDRDGLALPGIPIKVFARSLRAESLLGEGVTDRSGHYAVRYDARPHDGIVDLVVRAHDPDAHEKLLGESPLLTAAPNDLAVDLLVSAEDRRAPSEYERLQERIAPLLDGLDPAELSAEQVVYVAARSQFDPLQVAHFARGVRLAKETEIPAEVFYALFRDDLPVDLSALLAQHPDIRRTALRSAVEANRIPARFGSDEQMERVRNIEAQTLAATVLDRPLGPKRASLRELLATAIENREQQQAFVRLGVAHTGSTEQFWERVREEPSLREHVGEVQLALQLAAVAGGHLPLANALWEIKREGRIAGPRDLATWSEEEWAVLIGREQVGAPQDVAGADREEKAQRYARAITHMLEDAFPTTFLAARIDESDLAGKERLVRFFERNADFAIDGARLTNYLVDHPAALDGITEGREQSDALKAQIRALQRLGRVVERSSQALPLLKAGLHSAQAITRLGPTVFRRQYAKTLGGEPEAIRVFERAEQVTETALNLLADHGIAQRKFSMRVLQDLAPADDATIPDLRALFGSLDLCECEHCRSVYGPAAYLVDILHFLNDRKLIDHISYLPEPQPDGAVLQVVDTVAYRTDSAADVLLKRRPDLQEIELTCENTNIPVPYADLVNEVLEQAVASLPDFVPFAPILPAGTDLVGELDQREVSHALVDAFLLNGHHLSEDARVVVKKRGTWWTIEDLPCRYVVRKRENGGIEIESRGRQTSGTAHERAANPQYINPDAYATLARQVSPLGHANRLFLAPVPTSLPFNMWIEEIRAYLRHLGVARHELMEALLPGDRTAILSKADIAHEYLGLTPEEALIVKGTVAGQPGAAEPGVWNLWGFATQRLNAQSAIPDPADGTKWITATTGNPNDHDWLNILAERVDVFLQQSGLSYLELLALLDCYTINPLVDGDRKVSIVSRDPDDPDTADLAKLRLSGFDADTAADAIRFVRLWRKLGWPMRELDRVALALGSSQPGAPHIRPGALGDTFLTQLSHIVRLQRTLKVPVDRLAAWWAGNLTEEKHQREWWTLGYTDHDASGQPRLPSLYERLFRNRAVTNPIDPAFTEDPGHLAGTLSGHAAAITAALCISAADFALLLKDDGVIPALAADPSQPDDVLKLAHLGRLDRHAGLARALKLPIRDYLSLLELMVAEPFNSTISTLRFVERVERVRGSGFTIPELDYLLRHEFTKAAGVAPTEQAIALVLNDVRAGLKTIADENTPVDDPLDPRGVTIDPDGKLTREKLALLGWDAALSNEAMATLDDTAVYEADLPAVPPGIVLPNDTGAYEAALAAAAAPGDIPTALQGIVYYDAAAQQLRVLRALSLAEQKLLEREVPAAMAGGVQALLAQMNGLRGTIDYDGTARKLRFFGVMTNARLVRLQQASADNAYRTALQSLYQQPRTFATFYMRVFGAPVQDFTVEVPRSLAGIVFPDALEDRVHYDDVARKLHFVGVMTDPERTILLGLSDDADYRQAIDGLRANGGIEEDQRIFLLQVSNDADYRQSIQDLYDAPRTATPASNAESITLADRGTLFDEAIEPADRFVLVLRKLLPFLRRTLSEHLVKQKLSEALGLEAAIVHELLTGWLDPLGAAAPGKKAIADFLDPAFIASNVRVLPDRARFPHQFAAYIRLHKIALVVTRCRLTPRQVAWLFRYGAEAKWLLLGNLPLGASTIQGQDLEKLFAAWERLVDLVRLRDMLPLGEVLLSEVFTILWSAHGSPSDAFKPVCAEAKWSLAEAGDLTGAGGFGYASKEDYRSGRALLRVAEAFALLKRLGMSPAQGQALASVHGAQLLLADSHHLLSDRQEIRTRTGRLRAAAHSVVRAARAKYDEPQWLEISRALRDVLREQQRAALVAHLVTHPVQPPGGAAPPTWRDINDLFAYFLIDVEMSPCQLTSRIKQAIGAVQLFVQRSLMNLEPEVNTGAAFDGRWREWTWMKNYRVWEANRKVFLYPENWIEPELRDDKSPFFTELEKELLQADLRQTPDESDILLRTGNPVETAFAHYLEKLDAVAQLEVVGEYHQQERDAHGNLVVDQLHVFGRTPNTPYVYYYRRWVDASYWTAWERVDLDIEGDHLIPVVWNRRLYLLWPVFTEKLEDTELVMPDKNQPVKKGAAYWEIQLAWSEYRGARWTPIRLSPAVREPTPDTSPAPRPDPKKADRGKSLYVFRARAYPDSLEIWYEWFEAGRVGKDVMKGLSKGFRLEAGQVQVISTMVWGHQSLEGTTSVGMVLQEEGDKALCLPPLEADGPPAPVLASTPGRPFRLLYAYQDEALTGKRPFFYEDGTRSFFVNRETEWIWTVGKIEILTNVKLLDPGLVAMALGKYLEKPKVAPGPRPAIPEREALLMRTGDPLAFAPSFPLEAEATVAIESAAVATHDAVLAPAAPPTAPLALGPVALAGSLAAIPAAATRALAITASGPALAPQPSFSDSVELINRVLNPALMAFEGVLLGWHQPGYQFRTFYHPYVSNFVRHLNRDGVAGLMQRQLQLIEQRFFDVGGGYAPTDLVLKGAPTKNGSFASYPRDDVDFSYSGAYAPYNWELFFHAPLLIADRLSKNQCFVAAQQWFHHIFDPTDRSDYKGRQRYWRTKPFFETTDDEYWSQDIRNLLRFLAGGVSTKKFAALNSRAQTDLMELPKKIAEWRRKPFRPHLVARLRTTAYQKTVVMKYLDNLITWGDQLFRRDTIESINEATQLYILAAEILGARPEKIPPRAIAEVQTYASIKPRLDEFSNALVAIEEFVPPNAATGTLATEARPRITLPMLYFCVPKNDKLLGYWDTVADRLFKVRHCMNIEGAVRELPLFEPPIEPGLLVRAVAAGIDISSALNDINAALPHYRFNVMTQKASELCAEVKTLGGALLAALEKRDAEALALLRSTHERSVLEAARLVREQQIKETAASLEALRSSSTVVNERYVFYHDIERTNREEDAALGLEIAAISLEVGLPLALMIAAALRLIPDFKIGAPTSAGSTAGGNTASDSKSKFAQGLDYVIKGLRFGASLSREQGGYERRWNEWKLQERVAARELQHIEKQIAAAEIRKAITEQELRNHDRQIEHAREVDDFMHDKFTNHELYDWMVGQIASVYFQSYQLAYDVAKRAERAYRHELGLRDSSFIQFGYWDSLKKGLLAGERLAHDLKRLEAAYLEQNRREYEISKHVSLALVDPAALIRLRQTGECYVELPEALFDLDYPGHYMRRIKNAGLTIPCVVGPYTSVNCTLTLLKSSLRHMSTLLGGEYKRDLENEDPRFADAFGAVESIVTSSAQNDSGLFELSFRDERYLPFEGAGAISRWRIALPRELRQFDYDTISDVVLHLRYTARDGGDALRTAATDALWNALAQVAEYQQRRVFSLKHEFPTEWSRLLQPLAKRLPNEDPSIAQVKLDLGEQRFPFVFQRMGYRIDVERVTVLADLADVAEQDKKLTLYIAPPDQLVPAEWTLQTAAGAFGGLPHKPLDVSAAAPAEKRKLGTWTVQVRQPDLEQLPANLRTVEETGGTSFYRLNPDTVKDLLILFEFTVTRTS